MNETCARGPFQFSWARGGEGEPDISRLVLPQNGKIAQPLQNTPFPKSKTPNTCRMNSLSYLYLEAYMAGPMPFVLTRMINHGTIHTASLIGSNCSYCTTSSAPDMYTTGERTCAGAASGDGAAVR